MKKILLVLAALALALLGGNRAGAQEKTRISISGSDTMNVLDQRLAEEYMKKHPNVEISVTGGGSGRGIADLIEGLNDIAQASRKMKPEEIQKAKDNGYDPQEHVVALDGLAVVVNAANPVKELSLGQVKAIYTGAVKKWSDLDPAYPAEEIILLSRESNCGTYDFFKEHVLEKADFAKNTSYLAATAAIANSVGKDKNAIGFGGIAYFVHGANVKVLPIKGGKDKPAICPIDPEKHHVRFDVIQSGQYPISRPLQLYTREEATGEIKAFVDWVKGPEGQKIVEQVEYIPLASDAAAGAAKTQ